MVRTCTVQCWAPATLADHGLQLDTSQAGRGQTWVPNLQLDTSQAARGPT